MFRTSYNRAVLGIRVDTVTPLLIRAGAVPLDPVGADLACVRTHHATAGRTVYVPGSSLKGVLRSASEAAVRGTRTGGVEGACDPLNAARACGTQTDRVRDTAERYRQHCLACRLFGSTALRGRAAVRDLFPWRGTAVADGDRDNFARANHVEIRHGVAINRISGAVQHGPFDQEMVPAGVSFWGDVALHNYQLWQLGLLLQGFEALNTGAAQLGSSKSRGLGVVRIGIEAILHEQRPGGPDLPAGVGMLMREDERRAYGVLADGVVEGVRGEVHGLARRFVATGAEGVAPWLEAARRALEALPREGLP